MYRKSMFAVFSYSRGVMVELLTRGHPHAAVTEGQRTAFQNNPVELVLESTHGNRVRS